MRLGPAALRCACIVLTFFSMTHQLQSTVVLSITESCRVFLFRYDTCSNSELIISIRTSSHRSVISSYKTVHKIFPSRLYAHVFPRLNM